MIISLQLIETADTAKWCRLPYPDHPKGCPNFGKKDGCPPTAKFWNEIIEPPYYLVYQIFDLEAQEKRMLEKHSNWSKRQARCCLYWQRGLVNSIIFEAKELMHRLVLYSHGVEYTILENPEGAGINLFKTCNRVGIKLEKDYLNQRYVYKMVIIGKKKYNYHCTCCGKPFGIKPEFYDYCGEEL